MILPQQLQNREFRFILIKPNTKNPMESAWQQYNNYVYFNSKIRQAKNVGALCGKGGLVVLDIDDEKYLKEFDKKCNTFSVKTGSGKRHYYFICKDKFDRGYFVLTNGAGEIRVKNSQVLVPGSTHPNGNKYEVFNDCEIRNVTRKELFDIVGELLTKNGRMVDTTRSGKEWSEVCQMIEGGYNFDECDREMRLLEFSKWVESSEDYRVATYCNALKAIKNKYK